MPAGTLKAETVLIRSLLVYEAAINAYLRQSTARTILTAYGNAVAAGTDSAGALQNAFTNVVLAYAVETYLNSKKGLAKDLQMVTDFSRDALAAMVRGNEADSPADRAAEAESVARSQKKLNAALSRFMEGVSRTETSGDYAEAYDALHHFFHVAATLTEQAYWQQRSVTRGDEMAFVEAMGAIARSKMVRSGLTDAIQTTYGR